jgi:DNA-binding SARP family transcriptional activator
MGLQGVVPPGQDDSGATSSILSIKLLGKFSLHVGDHEIELLSRKTKALLGYLALTETQEESRERLIGLFWSEVPEERARASLRQALHEIRNSTDSTPTNLSSGSIGRGYAWI